MFIAAVLAASAMVYSQPGSFDDSSQRKPEPENRIEKIQRLDSVIGFIRDSQTGIDLQDYVFIYMYDKNKVNPAEVVRLKLPERTYINRQLYSYADDGFKTRYLYQEWITGAWTDRMIVEYFPNDAGKLGRELFSTPDVTGSWIPYQEHLYSYDYLGRIALYLRRMSDANGGWYDFSENIWTFNNKDRLLQRIEKRVADDYVIWTENYYYGGGIKPTERIRQTMRYDPVLKRNTLMNDTRQLYYYDELMDPVLMEQYKWINGDWVFTGKSQYYYSFIPGRKVAMCHYGQTIYVAPKDIRAHLAHGDRIGVCEEESDLLIRQPGTSASGVVKYAKVFPNPASDHFELALRSGHGFQTADLISNDGRVMRSTDITSLERVVFEVSGLSSGQYILKLCGETSSEDILIVIR